MVIDKNRMYARGQAKGTKSKVVEPSTKNEWYNVKVPKTFQRCDVGRTGINKTGEAKIVGDGRLVHVTEQRLVDLVENEKYANYIVKLRFEDVNNRDCLIVFCGMQLENDKCRTPIKKWASVADARGDVKTADGNMVRMFGIAMTSRKKGHTEKTSNAQQLQKKVRNVMIKTMTAEVVSKDINGLIEYPKDATLSRHIVSRCSRIFPLENVRIWNVKVVKADKDDSLNVFDSGVALVMFLSLFFGLLRRDSAEHQVWRACSIHLAKSIRTRSGGSWCPCMHHVVAAREG